MGDGRLSLNKEADDYFSLLILDAFSSDAIPVHLVTLEALKLYLSKLTSNGLLAFNISNRYLDLEPVLGHLAKKLGLLALVQTDKVDSDDIEAKRTGKKSSKWVILARNADALGRLASDPRWKPARVGKDSRTLWTDQFSNILSAYLGARHSA